MINEGIIAYGRYFVFNNDLLYALILLVRCFPRGRILKIVHLPRAEYRERTLVVEHILYILAAIAVVCKH